MITFTQLARKLLGLPSPSGLPAYSINVRDEFKGVYGDLALQTLINHYSFITVLDIGSGAGRHADIFEKHGKRVTAVDFCCSKYFQERAQTRKVLKGDYLTMTLDKQFDCVWASHVLEHQPNPNLFLKKVHQDVKEGGVVAITIPPLKHDIVGGHLSLWNAGLLLYHLVFAGFDCKQAAITSYDYNISVILNKVSIELPILDYDCGDINRLTNFFPEGLSEGFNGDIHDLNWPA